MSAAARASELLDVDHGDKTTGVMKEGLAARRVRLSFVYMDNRNHSALRTWTNAALARQFDAIVDASKERREELEEFPKDEWWSSMYFPLRGKLMLALDCQKSTSRIVDYSNIVDHAAFVGTTTGIVKANLPL
jgi:hypothetical protein